MESARWVTEDEVVLSFLRGELAILEQPTWQFVLAALSAGKALGAEVALGAAID